MKEFIIDENLFFLYHLLTEIDIITFDNDIRELIRELRNLVDKKLFSEIDSRDLKEYHIIFRYEIEEII